MIPTKYTKYITVETGYGLLALTIALCGSAIIPRWDEAIQYCVPNTECRVIKEVDPHTFNWHQEQAKQNAQKLAQRKKTSKKSDKWYSLAEDAYSNWDNATYDFGESWNNISHTFSPRSTKEFLAITTVARRQGWQLKMVGELPGYAVWRKVTGALSLISVGGLIWVIAQLEEIQPKRDRLEELNFESAINRHQKALEGETTVITAEMDWEVAAGQKQLEAQYLGDDADEFLNTLDAQTSEFGKDADRQEGMLNQITGTQTLDSINNPSDKVQGNNSPAIINDREHYLNIGDRILDKLGTLTQSTILISSPGAGKTTAICTAWGRMKKRLGDKFHATVIVYKAKDESAFKGIADEVICFPHNPDDAIIAILNFVEEMKTGVTGNNTRRLFIDDFLTTWSEIEALYKGKYLTHNNDFTFNKKLGKAPVTDWLISQLNAVFLIGRESNDALWISSHSPNVEDLPFVESKGARIAGNLLFLARQDLDNSNGNYEVIQQNINNAHLVASEHKRKELAVTLPGLIILSQQSGEPIILTSHGASGGWELGLIGKHIRKEYEDYRQEWSSSIERNKLPKQETEIVDSKPNRPDFNELLDAIVKSFSDKGATKISRIPSGCNRVRTALSEFDDDRKKDILVYLVERLVQQGLAEVVGDKSAEQKVKEGKPTLTTDHEFLIITQ